MAVQLRKGGAVHYGPHGVPACNPWKGSANYREVTAEVTCKKCLTYMEKHGATAKPAEAESTKGETMTEMPTTASTIKASDFNRITTDELRNRWTGADLANVVKALDGATVIVEADPFTGFSVVGKLLAVNPGYHTSPTVTIENLSGVRTNYSVWNLGNIVVLGASNAKWTALDLQRAEHRAIGERACARLTEKVGGKLRGHVRYVGLNPGEYVAQYEPYRSDPRNPAGRTQYANVSV